MKLIVKGGRHTAVWGSDCAAPDFVHCCGKTLVRNGNGQYAIPAGEYEMVASTWNNQPWLRFAGTDVGGAMLFFVQWAGEAWYDMEMLVLDDVGNPVFGVRGEYTFAREDAAIASGRITDPRVIRRARERAKNKTLEKVL